MEGPPADVGAERQLLGAALTAPYVIDEVTEVLEPDDFFRPAHETIWRAVLAQHEARKPVDPKLISDRLQTDGDLQRVGGLPYIAELVTNLLTAVNATHYADIIARYAGQRRLLAVGQRIAQLASAMDTTDLAEVQERCRAELDAAVGTSAARLNLVWLQDEIDPFLEVMETPAPMSSTGWPDVDALLGGFAPGRLYVMGGRPGVGKTVMGVQAAAYHCNRHEAAAVFVSLEMSRQEVHAKLVSQIARVPYDHLERRLLSPEDWNRIAEARGKIADMKLTILDRASVRIVDIRRYARTLQHQTKLGLIVVDYLQLMASPDRRQPRHEVVADFSRSLKLLARELGVPILVISQLNRASESRADRLPTLSDLRESGAVEQDADAVLLLHRDLNDQMRMNDVRVMVAKNRHGPVGSVTLAFDGMHQRVVAKALQQWTPEGPKASKPQGRYWQDTD